MPTFTITRYGFQLLSSRPSAQTAAEIAIIQLYGAPPDNAIHGTMRFHPDGVELPQPEFTADSVTLYFHVARLGVVMQFLREESAFKVTGFADSGGVKHAYLWTHTFEPVGEEEGAAG
jgi:hypothetical protein